MAHLEEVPYRNPTSMVDELELLVSKGFRHIAFAMMSLVLTG